MHTHTRTKATGNLKLKWTLVEHFKDICNIFLRYVSAKNRSHSGAHGTASGCQGKNWSPPRQQAAVETSTWPASPSVDATTGSRNRTRRWCRMGHSQWSSSMEGTTTHRRSSGLMNEWMNEQPWWTHNTHNDNETYELRCAHLRWSKEASWTWKSKLITVKYLDKFWQKQEKSNVCMIAIENDAPMNTKLKIRKIKDITRYTNMQKEYFS